MRILMMIKRTPNCGGMKMNMTMLMMIKPVVEAHCGEIG